MDTTTSDSKQSAGKGIVLPRKSYRKPALKHYGLVKNLTQSTGSQNGDGGQNMMISDRNLKQNIVRVGVHPLGIGLYLFDYKPEFRNAWGYGRQFGVMAQEVETVMPEAVVMHPDGYKTVNYTMLGINRTTH